MQTRGDVAAELLDVNKSFGSVVANNGVSLKLRWGKVHALLGENGAGKSTLCAILAGLYSPDAGTVIVDGKRRNFQSPRDALSAGIGMVYQHFKLAAALSVAENVCLGQPGQKLVLSRHQLEARTRALTVRYGLEVDPGAYVWQLSVGEQQRVELLKLLYRGTRILLFDEPTAVLAPAESTALYNTIRVLKAEGRAIVLVSHKLEEVLAISDEITVLRDGRRVASMDRTEADEGTLATMMVGRDFKMVRTVEKPLVGEPVLTVESLEVEGAELRSVVNGVDLRVNRGEIFGLAGVSGNGQRELAEAIAGMRGCRSGRIVLEGEDVTHRSTIERTEAGIAYVPDDRLGVGLAPGLSVRDNMILKSYGSRFSRGPVLSKGRIDKWTNDLMSAFDIRAPDVNVPVAWLSGGNSQRVLLARELSSNPRLIVACSPSRGLDISATNEVRRLLIEQRSKGAAVLLISEDLDEIMAISDRVGVIFGGRIMGEFPREEADIDALGMMMAGKWS